MGTFSFCLSYFQRQPYFGLNSFCSFCSFMIEIVPNVDYSLLVILQLPAGCLTDKAHCQMLQPLLLLLFNPRCSIMPGPCPRRQSWGDLEQQKFHDNHSCACLCESFVQGRINCWWCWWNCSSSSWVSINPTDAVNMPASACADYIVVI